MNWNPYVGLQLIGHGSLYAVCEVFRFVVIIVLTVPKYHVRRESVPFFVLLGSHTCQTLNSDSSKQHKLDTHDTIKIDS